MAAINVAKKLCATQKQILWHTTFLSAIYRLTMSTYQSIEEEMFGSSDDDWDTQTTQETSQLTVNSPLSSDSESTSSDDKFINNDEEEEFNLADSDDEASNHRRVDQNRSPSPENPFLDRLERRYGRQSLSSSSSTSSSKNSSSKKRNNC